MPPPLTASEQLTIPAKLSERFALSRGAVPVRSPSFVIFSVTAPLFHRHLPALASLVPSIPNVPLSHGYRESELVWPKSSRPSASSASRLNAEPLVPHVKPLEPHIPLLVEFLSFLRLSSSSIRDCIFAVSVQSKAKAEKLRGFIPLVRKRVKPHEVVSTARVEYEKFTGLSRSFTLDPLLLLTEKSLRLTEYDK